ncbi:type VI secretion system protein TssA [Salinisphaera sp. Q1T1-3]|uniref:type VI secretion system protein TssA n=1 Tax=Salinisphaera sp. Q1T1-3 TaxID=2321229 RepID=UPI000E73BD55|nr:type VI secretion system protein TssA [Salinisphaera sp. Q1T1-3]RJS91684.1 type VI secretion system protein TssA [Salinisphaera sp. Q1T1-3]
MTNLARLCEAISDDDPCGEDMSLSPEFDSIIEARRADDPSLEQGEWVTELKSADWPRVARLCTELLENKTKDIRVCVWLTEAWAHLHGFAGLSDAYQLFAQLCATDWDGLHPQPDETGDEEARINNVGRLIETSIPLMRQQAITQSSAGAFSAADLASARHAATHARDDSEDDVWGDAHNGGGRLAQYETARRDTPAAFYRQTLHDLDECLAAIGQLDRTLDEKLGGEAPSFGNLRETALDIHGLIKRSAEDVGVDTSADAESVGGTEQAASDDGDAPINTATISDEAIAATAPSAAEPQPQASGPIRSRAQALSQLRQVADYFRRNEPHSPVAYMAETAAKWGDMPLHAWLRSVIRDDGELSHVEELLGLSRQRRQSGGGESASDDDFDGEMYQ